MHHVEDEFLVGHFLQQFDLQDSEIPLDVVIDIRLDTGQIFNGGVKYGLDAEGADILAFLVFYINLDVALFIVLGQAPFALDALIAQIIKIVAGGQSRGRQAGAQQQAQKDFFHDSLVIILQRSSRSGSLGRRANWDE